LATASTDGGLAAAPCRLAAGVPWAGPYAGTYTEASTSKSPTIKQSKALVTSGAHGQPCVCI